MEELQEVFDQLDGQASNTLDGIHVHSAEDAAKYARWLHHLREEIKENEAVAESERAHWQEKLAAVDSWLEGVNKKRLDAISFVEAQLSSYHSRIYDEANEAQRAKIKSISLPYGVKLTSRAVRPKLVADTSNEELIAYAKKEGFTEDTPPKVLWGELKKRLKHTEAGLVLDTESGELLPFISVENLEGSRTFEVK
ncbi:host-nuclease inhibitor Gam family protein [Bacillus pumilus]|uniref:host-nuclease inhibitor Gam family protein n=1 Tax=Bacillus TaxID=1386 RepID=UPI001C21B9E0|nr:host-nuclease inhibitor Gam family protein [Bacillus pumilus]MBU8576395.1 host-nuclease inhibitor Gam family protein [Bacillus pumilus]